MGSRIASRALLSNSLASSLVSRFSPSLPRPLVATAFSLPSAAVATTTFLRTYHRKPNPNWSNRSLKKIFLEEGEGCDYEHWLCIMKPPEDANATREDIIDSYIKTLAMVIGSEEEARMKIYSVSTQHFYVFGALLPEDVSLKLNELPRVRFVTPDEYLDVKKKDFGGEPFINGEAVGYDKKYHEQWIQKNKKKHRFRRLNKLDDDELWEKQGPTGRPPPVRSVNPQTAICLLGRITCNHLLCRTTSRDFLRRACLGILCSSTHPKRVRYPRAKLSHRNDQELLHNHSPRWF